jgi:hypothetical protein
MEAIKVDAELGKEFECRIYAREVCIHAFVYIPIPKVSSHRAEGICAHLAIERVPPCHCESTPITHFLSHYNFIWLIIFESQRIRAIGCFVFDFLHPREKLVVAILGTLCHWLGHCNGSNENAM